MVRYFFTMSPPLPGRYNSRAHTEKYLRWCSAENRLVLESQDQQGPGGSGPSSTAAVEASLRTGAVTVGRTGAAVARKATWESEAGMAPGTAVAGMPLEIAPVTLRVTAWEAEAGTALETAVAGMPPRTPVS